MDAVTIEPSKDNEIILSTFDDTGLFSVDVSINPLVACAQPLLSIIQRLNLTSMLEKPMELKQQIENELLVFNHRVEEAEFHPDILRVSRFLLTAVLDEMFSKLQWQNINDYLCIGRFTQFGNDGVESGERFFFIVEKLFDNPNDHLELLELAYLCLSFGFEGKYRETPNKREQLDFILDRLYELVKRHRSTEQKHMLISANQLRERSPGIKPLSVMSLVVTLVLLISLSFVGFNALLGKQIHQQHVQIAQNPIKSETVAHG